MAPFQQYVTERSTTQRLRIAGTGHGRAAIRIPDEVGRALMARGADITREVLEAVAIEGVPIRRGVTPACVQEMLGFRSRWETESFLHHAEAYHDYTMDDLDRDIAAIRGASGQ